MSDTYLNLTGLTSYDAKLKAIQEHNIDNGYAGVDLTQKFKSEIGSTNAWKWIKQRIDVGDYEGINIADYIPETLPASVTDTTTHIYHIQVAGINTYTGTWTNPYATTADNGYLGNHIDFCSKECPDNQDIMWQEQYDALGNNGNATSTTTTEGVTKSQCPYMISTLKQHYESYFTKLPHELQSVIADKYMYMEGRYSSNNGGTLLTDSNSGWNKVNLGKLWSPTESEVFGARVLGTPFYSNVTNVQYPLFRSYNTRTRFYYDGTGETTYETYWWTATTVSGSSADVVCVSNYGCAYDYRVDDEDSAPLCFRICAGSPAA